jgi:hypothetical protein
MAVAPTKKWIGTMPVSPVEGGFGTALGMT